MIRFKQWLETVMSHSATMILQQLKENPSDVTLCAILADALEESRYEDMNSINILRKSQEPIFHIQHFTQGRRAPLVDIFTWTNLLKYLTRLQLVPDPEADEKNATTLIEPRDAVGQSRERLKISVYNRPLPPLIRDIFVHVLERPHWN
jgi:hypothetical protein